MRSPVLTTTSSPTKTSSASWPKTASSSTQRSTDIHYGVPKTEVTEPLARGENVIVKVNVQGAATLKRLFPDAVLIFISPGEIEVAQARLQARQTDSPEATQLRVATAPSEMRAADDFDYVVINETGQLEATARRVVEIIAVEKAKRL